MTDGALPTAGTERRLDLDGSTTVVARWVELHRLAVAGRESVIARDVGDRVGRVWLHTSRFADVAALAQATLTLGPDAAAFYHLGWAQSVTGRFMDSLTSNRQALALHREAGNRADEANTLNNLGLAYSNVGDRQQALAYFQQALPILREAGNRSDEANTLNNLGAVHDNLGDRQQALACYQQALLIMRESGDRAGEATTLNNIGAVYNNLDDQQQAFAYFHRALSTMREVGDRVGEAIARYNIAMIHRADGDLDRAIDELVLVVELDRQINHPDLNSDTAMLEQVRQERAQTHR